MNPTSWKTKNWGNFTLLSNNINDEGRKGHFNLALTKKLRFFTSILNPVKLFLSSVSDFPCEE